MKNFWPARPKRANSKKTFRAFATKSGKFNQLASTASASYQFVANGNTTQKSEGSNFWRYRWDYENRLTRASTKKQNVRCKYDALGRRIERNFDYGKERTKFTHDGLDVLVDDDFGTLTKYLNGPGIEAITRALTMNRCVRITATLVPISIRLWECFLTRTKGAKDPRFLK